MASYGISTSEVSDGDPDEQVFLPGIAEEPRITKLGSRIPIPSQSDLLESEGPEEILYLPKSQLLPEAIINGVIVPNSEALHAPEVPTSSATGKLKRPSSGFFRRESETASRGDPFEIGASPERGIRPSSGVPLKKPKKVPSSRRQQKPTRIAPPIDLLDADAPSDDVVDSHSTINQLSHKPPQPANKRPKRNHDAVPDLPNSHPSSPVVPEDTPPSLLDEQQPDLKSRPQNPPRTNQVVQVVINKTVSTKPSKDNTYTRNRRTSPPTAAQDSSVTVKSPGLSADIVEDQYHASSAAPADSVASPIAVNDVQPKSVEEGQRASSEDSALFVSPTPPTRNTRSQAEVLARDVQRVQELNEKYGPRDEPEDYTAEIDDFETEVNGFKNISMPEELKEALKMAHFIHEDAKEIRQGFDDIHILRSYGRLKRTIVQWKEAQNYSETGHLVQSSNEITEEARAIFQKPVWDQRKGLNYIHKRVLPTLVRMLYVTLAYHLAKVQTLNKLPYGPRKESESIVDAIIHICHEARSAGTRYIRTQDTVSMIARIKKWSISRNFRLKDRSQRQFIEKKQFIEKEQRIEKTQLTEQKQLFKKQSI
ncbi:unnamed protein product [Aureobasidium uvarum]|uniref:Uncharacterized protein n=1 Tax=Aureobasidium uvarum TaxID=2773716 RepID=A0A9N8PYM2_9PEZI|nr:unnamed protein product [Aureobasidium uvarum]